MNKLILIPLFLLGSLSGFTQSPATKRAGSMGKGINLTWMDQHWNGTDAMEHRDYINVSDLPKYKKHLELIHQLGYRLVRFPVCFDRWYADEKSYQLLTPQYYPALDSILQWTKQLNIKIIVDYHHGKLRKDNLVNDTEKICAVWKEVAKRYKDTDPERVFFEIFNEPSDIEALEWNATAQKIVAAIRTVDTLHTLIVGGAKWNGIDGLLEMTPLSDKNIIYTFHCYDPFLFTHQGADWAGDAASTTGLPYPYDKRRMPAISEAAMATWAIGPYNNYANEANYEGMYARIKTAKDWSEKNKVPVFCGEWGAYKTYMDKEDRCRYLKDIYAILDTLKIPNAMWEWHEGFSFFDAEPAKENISSCMKEAMRLE